MGNKTRMCREIITASMLQNQHAPFCQQRQSCIGNVSQILQCIRRICEDNIVAFLARTYIFKYVSLQRQPFIHLQFLLHARQELPMFEIFFHRHHLSASTRGQLQTNGACACKEIKGSWFLIEINIHVLQDIEESLFGKVGRRTCLKARRSGNMTSLIFSSDDSHLNKLLDMKIAQRMGWLEATNEQGL